MPQRDFITPPIFFDVAFVLQHFVCPAFLDFVSGLQAVVNAIHPAVELQHAKKLGGFHARVGLALCFAVVKQIVLDYNVDIFYAIPGDDAVDEVDVRCPVPF